jgi:hypothetical protein
LQLANKEDSDMNYYYELLLGVKEFVHDTEEPWAIFKSKADLLKKENMAIAKRIIRLGLFPESALQELEGENEEENKAINLFEKWLSTAH